MKIKGRKIEGPNVEIVVIPRAEREAIVFRCAAVLEYSAFEKLCPPPQPPKVQRPGGEWMENVEDAEYKQKVAARALLEIHWMVLESLKATSDLEWEQVKGDDPSTWAKWTDELKDAGFSMVEVNRIRDGVWRANCLDERVIEEARRSFFHSQEVQVR